MYFTDKKIKINVGVKINMSFRPLTNSRLSRSATELRSYSSGNNFNQRVSNNRLYLLACMASLIMNQYNPSEVVENQLNLNRDSDFFSSIIGWQDEPDFDSILHFFSTQEAYSNNLVLNNIELIKKFFPEFQNDYYEVKNESLSTLQALQKNKYDEFSCSKATVGQMVLTKSQTSLFNGDQVELFYVWVSGNWDATFYYYKLQ